MILVLLKVLLAKCAAMGGLAMGIFSDASGPNVPTGTMQNTSTGKPVTNTLIIVAAAMVAGIRVVKLNPIQAFADTNYEVIPVFDSATDVAHAAQTFHVNKVSASEFHIVSDSAVSTSLVGAIAMG